MLRKRTGNSKQRQKALEGNKNRNTHNQRQNSNCRPAFAAAQIKPCVIPLKIPYFLHLTPSSPNLNACPGHGCHRRNRSRIPCRRRRCQKSKEQRYGGADQQISPFSRTVCSNQAEKLLRVLCQKHFRRQLIQRRTQKPFCRQTPKQQTHRDSYGAKKQNLRSNHPVKLSLPGANCPERPILPDTPGNSNLQNIINHQPCRQQDQGCHKHAHDQQPGKTGVIHCQLGICGFRIIVNPKCMQ